MSVKVQTYVWQLRLTPTQKLVAIALADHCHDDGSEARPSQALLCRKTGLSVRTVSSTLASLVNLGVLSLERQSGQHSPNVYRVLIPEGFATIPDPQLSQVKNPDLQMTRQTCNSRRPDLQLSQPNHKEPSIETNGASSIPMPAGFKESLGFLR